MSGFQNLNQSESWTEQALRTLSRLLVWADFFKKLRTSFSNSNIFVQYFPPSYLLHSLEIVTFLSSKDRLSYYDAAIFLLLTHLTLPRTVLLTKQNSFRIIPLKMGVRQRSSLISSHENRGVWIIWWRHYFYRPFRVKSRFFSIWILYLLYMFGIMGYWPWFTTTSTLERKCRSIKKNCSEPIQKLIKSKYFT